MSVTIFTLNRPEVANAFNLDAALDLQKAAQSALKKKQSGLIITASQSKTFCSGGDLKSYKKMKTKTQGLSVHRKIRRILTSLKKSPILVVAALEGDALGGGCELVLAADVIIASQRARFSFRQVKQGLSTGWGGATPLLKRVRNPTALDWLTSGRWISSSEAIEKGLVDRVVPDGQTLSAAELFIEEHATPLAGTFKNLIQAGGAGEDKIFEKLWWSKLHLAALKGNE